MTLRGRFRAGLEASLDALGAVRWQRNRRRGRVLILAYHNIVRHGERPAGERSLHLDQEMFAAQLDLLKSTHEVISLDRLTDLRKGPADRPRAVITWDDAYRGAVTAGVEEVSKRGLPATIFACPDLLGGAAFWWDRLAESVGGVLPPELRERALEEWLGDAATVTRQAGAGADTRLPPYCMPATLEELQAATSKPGITVASHTWSHPNLTRIAGDRLDRELSESLSWLRTRFPQFLPWLSYPYGLHTREVGARAAAAGYRGALAITGGWVPPRADPFSLPRLNVSAGLSLRGFALRLAGLFCT